MTTLDLVTFGETMVLLTNPDVTPLRHASRLRVGIGGAESNTAIGFVRLGGRAAWMGRVGADEFGALILARLRGERLDVEAATVDADAPTGLMIKSPRPGGGVQVAYYRRDSAGSRLGPEHLDRERIVAARFLHLTGITPALSATAREAVHAAIEIAKEAGAVVSFDPNFRAALWPADEAARSFRDLAARADIVLAGLDEARLMYGHEDPKQLVGALHDAGVAQAVVKLGRDGALGIVDGEEVRAASSPQVVVDPVGAGDAFAAGYLSALARGAAPTERLDLANRLSAIAVTTQGDWEGFPLADEIDLPGDDVLR